MTDFVLFHNTLKVPSKMQNVSLQKHFENVGITFFFPTNEVFGKTSK